MLSLISSVVFFTGVSLTEVSELLTFSPVLMENMNFGLPCWGLIVNCTVVWTALKI